MPHLVFVDERFGRRSFELVCERTSVGRGPENTLTIRDRSLSREHCEILTFGSEVIIRDLGSRNGTFIDGHPLRGGQAQVKHGQIVSFGTVQARVEIEYIGEEGNETTAIHDFVKFRDQEHHPIAMEAVHMAIPDTAPSIDQTVHLRAPGRPASPTLPPSIPATDSNKAVRQQPIWIAIWIALLLALLLSLWR